MKVLLHCISFVCVFIICTLTGFSSNEGNRMAKANELAAGGKYQEAIDLYKKLMEDGKESCVLYYNLGNAYFKLGKLSKAILSYERASRISPKDEDILHNLKIANQEVKFPVNNLPTLFYVRWWRNVVNIFSPTVWGVLFLLFLWGAFVAWGLFVYRKEPLVRKRGFYVGSVLTIFSCLLLLFAYSRYQYRYHTPQAIITAEETPLQSGPSDDSEMTTNLTEGVKVSVKDQLDEWMNVVLSDGREGWIVLEDMERI